MTTAIKFPSATKASPLEEPIEAEPTVAEVVEELNQKHAHVLVGDRVRILMDEPGEQLVLLAPAEFRNLYCNRFCRASERNKLVSAPDAWLSSPHRRSHSGIVFRPGCEDTGAAYNLWRGWAVAAEPGDVKVHCSLFFQHLAENVCQGNPTYLAFIVAWFAHLVQRPMDRIGVALVFRGEQGVGKSKVFEIVGRLLGCHFRTASQPSHVTGRFNGPLEGCLLLLAEEAFWAGDKTAEAVIKDMITSPRMNLERKGIDAISIENFLHLAITSNEKWVVPAGVRERRFAVFEVGKGRMQDAGYFRAMDAQMESGGYAVLLHYLLHYEYDELTLRRIPNTDALQEQKIESLDPFHQWVRDFLHKGELPGDVDGDGLSKNDDFHADYVRRVQVRTGRARASETQLGDAIHDLFPGVVAKRVTGPSGKRERYRQFPPLTECRRLFMQATSVIVTSEPDSTDWSPRGEAK